MQITASLHINHVYPPRVRRHSFEWAFVLCSAETAEALHRRRRMQDADGPVVEHTLALLKPDFVKKGDMAVARLLSRMRYDGFAIVRQKKLEPVLKRELAHELYKEHENRSFFPKLMDYMASGPAFAIELQAVDAVQKWRDMIGPTDPAVAKVEAPQSLRAKHVRFLCNGLFLAILL